MSENADGGKKTQKYKTKKTQVSLAKESAISWASIYLNSYLHTMKMMKMNRTLSGLVT